MSLIKGGGKALLVLASLHISGKAWAWNAGASADVSAPFVEGDPVMSFGGSFTWPFTPKYSLSLGMGVEKNFYVDSETKEFEFADSTVSFNIYPRTLIPTVGWTLRLILTLPTSEASQTNEIYSKPEARWTAAWPVVDSVNVALHAFIRYYWTRWETTKPRDGTGGVPLPQFSGGVGHSGNWQFMPDWTASYGANYVETRYYTNTYEGTGDPAINVKPDQSYTFFTSVNWAITEEDSVSLSYNYGSVLLQPGIDDYVLFDKEESRWSIGYSRSFKSSEDE